MLHLNPDRARMDRAADFKPLSVTSTFLRPEGWSLQHEYLMAEPGL